MKNKDNRVEITRDNAKESKPTDQFPKKRYVLPEQYNTLAAIGMKYSADTAKVSGTTTIYDGDIAVIEIDRKTLSKTINDKILARKTTTGITKLFDVREDAVELGYKRADQHVLSVEGTYDDLVFWMI